MKNIKTFKSFNEMLDPLGSWNPNDNLEKKFNEVKKEIKHFGFLQTDLLSTIIIYENDRAKLYLFNWGNYGKMRNYLESLSDSDFNDIENWLSDRFRDEDMDVYPDVISIKSINKSEIMDTDILSSYPDGEIGDLVIKILIRM